jgi:hypothetical protein
MKAQPDGFIDGLEQAALDPFYHHWLRIMLAADKHRPYKTRPNHA